MANRTAMIQPNNQSWKMLISREKSQISIPMLVIWIKKKVQFKSKFCIFPHIFPARSIPPFPIVPTAHITSQMIA